MSRDTVYAALYAKLAGAHSFKTKGRRLRHWKDVQPENHPAMFLVVSDQVQRSSAGAPLSWAFHAELTLYAYDSSLDGVPQIALNAILDDIEAALAADDPATDRCTLGGVVRDCRIEGTIETDKGVLGPQAVAIVPLIILPKLD